MSKPVVAVGSVDMASSPEEAWPLLTDTDRTNRLIGSRPVEYHAIEAEAESATSARFIATTSAGGFKLSYEEAPFEWTKGKSFSIVRRMRSGPLLSYALAWTLERAKHLELGTRATVRIELVPRFWFLWPIAWLNARRFVGSLVHLAEAIDAHVREKAPSPYLKPVSLIDEDHLGHAVAAMKKGGLDDATTERLAEFVRSAPDADLVRIRPFEVADRWNEDRRAVLRAFLRAVPAGLVELRWGIICPSCLTASEQVRALDEISTEGHCQLCDISFDLDLDRAIEATFIVHPSIRTVPEQLFCIGGPARTPHVLVQANVGPGETRTLEVPSETGRYRVFARGGASATLEIAEGAPPEAAVTVDPSAVHPTHVDVAHGGKLAVTNATKSPRHVKIERLGFASAAATAHLVTTVGEFRTLFSSDLLKRGTPLKVARVAVFFSDLTGSTALYSKVGDAAAFRLVDDHFDVLRKVVEEFQGAFVKTMGDAVMATFSDVRQCARAAVTALERFESFRARERHGAEIGLKLGMYAGPCYVVTANGALDYFGQTVNVASRVQHLAAQGELVMAREHFAMLPPDDRARLAVGEDFEARVKGVESPLELVRVRLVEKLVEAAPSSSMRTSSDVVVQAARELDKRPD